MLLQQARENVEQVFVLYEKFGQADYIGEPVSQVEHMVQAAQLAEGEGYEEEVVLAAFFHDIGHLCEFVQPVVTMGGAGVADHETIGADFLIQKGFSERMGKLVQSHVPAKRYLTYKFPEYFEKLSPASKATLSYQGGMMSEEEARRFENDPYFPLYVKLREWDDKAKETNLPYVLLNKYKQMAIAHLLASQK
jgi:phosphonate degradation associated HDIG domain protein